MFTIVAMISMVKKDVMFNGYNGETGQSPTLWNQEIDTISFLV